MFQVIIKLAATLVILLGVILIYDARSIVKKIFGFGDQNEAAGGLKILGSIIGIIGIMILLWME